ncbi:MAG: PhoH family protein [Oscillospiraceae bacterium]
MDLLDKSKSGLVNSLNVLKNIEDISIHYFNEKDVVRHRLVREIIKAYEKNEEEYTKFNNDEKYSKGLYKKQSIKNQDTKRDKYFN